MEKQFHFVLGLFPTLHLDLSSYLSQREREIEREIVRESEIEIERDRNRENFQLQGIYMIFNTVYFKIIKIKRVFCKGVELKFTLFFISRNQIHLYHKIGRTKGFVDIQK